MCFALRVYTFLPWGALKHPLLSTFLLSAIPKNPEHRIFHFFRRSPNFRRFPKFWKIFENDRKLHMPHSRRHGRPRSSRSQHSNPGGARCLSSTSVKQMLAAASIKVMDALFGLVARNDAEWSIGKSFWDAHGVEIRACAIYDNFRRSKILKFGRASNKWKIGCSGPPAPTWPNGRAGCLRDPRSAEPLMICGLDLSTPSRPYHFGAPPTHHEPTQTRFCHRA